MIGSVSNPWWPCGKKAIKTSERKHWPFFWLVNFLDKKSSNRWLTQLETEVPIGLLYTVSSTKSKQKGVVTRQWKYCTHCTHSEPAPGWRPDTKYASGSSAACLVTHITRNSWSISLKQEIVTHLGSVSSQVSGPDRGGHVVSHRNRINMWSTKTQI